MNLLMPYLMYEDLDPDLVWQSPGRTITETDILAFAGFSGDFNVIHTDHEYAKTTAYRRPIAHGFGIFSIASGLSYYSPATKTVALLSVTDWKFIAPVFVGDTIHVLSRVVEKSLKGVGKRGEVLWHRTILNQEGKTVQEGRMSTLVECRAKG